MSAISSRIIRLIVLIFALSVMVGITSADDPTVGTINPATSIIGQNIWDSVGSHGVKVLPSGNIVILSPNWNGARGAVTCLTPAEYRVGGIEISEANSLVGTTANDSIGRHVSILTTGDYVVASYDWDNGSTADVGAVTWVDGDTCIPFGETTRAVAVSPSNSMIGTVANDRVGFGGTAALPNGNYVIISPTWLNGGLQVGAVTWCRATSPCVGQVSAANSLIGQAHLDNIGSSSVTVLSDGDYVVSSPTWNGGRGAVTWCSATAACIGVVNATNSLVGTRWSNGQSPIIVKLNNGNYVVDSPNWNDGVSSEYGAATWCSGVGGCKGEISAANSLIGGLTAADTSIPVRVYALSTGHYVVRNSLWDNGGATDAGAVTWCNGTSGCKGTITAANSMVGTAANEQVGSSMQYTTTGGYVISVPLWNNGAVSEVGAVRVCSGTQSCSGAITPSNALIGTSPFDRVGSRVIVLTNGNIVVSSRDWDNPDGNITNVGAVTFINTTQLVTGVVSASNSLIGSTAFDQVGHNVAALANGHYVVTSPTWDNGSTEDVGAITWGNGQTGTVGVVNPANSMIGTLVDDSVGNNGAYPLNNGNYIVVSSLWNGLLGAITWCNGTMPCVGTVSASNSLVGSTVVDFTNFWTYAALSGSQLFFSLPNGNYIIGLPKWDSTTEIDAGAIVIGDGYEGTFGVITASNAAVGNNTNDLQQPRFYPLPNGDVIVHLIYWDNEGVVNAGAIRRLNGSGSSVGAIDQTNSLVGSNLLDFINANFTIQPDNSFFINIPSWNSNRGVVIYSAGPENLLKNAGYESAGSTAKLASNWKLTLGAASGDRRICDKATKPLTRTEGKCVFQFNSSSTPLKARTLKQVINAPTWGVAGNILTLTADIEGVKVTGSTRKIVMNIRYDNNTTDRATIVIPAGTYDYQTLLTTVRLTRPVAKVTVTINVGTAKGRIRIDNLFLSASPAATLRFPALGESTTRDGASPFELPVAPNGFRN